MSTSINLEIKHNEVIHGIDFVLKFDPLDIESFKKHIKEWILDGIDNYFNGLNKEISDKIFDKDTNFIRL